MRSRETNRLERIHFRQPSVGDLSGTWDVTTGLELRGGVRNLFGKNPPPADNNSAPANSINGSTFPGTYDALGRVIFIGATAKL
jgi:iron complex outermembrane receptor protein